MSVSVSPTSPPPPAMLLLWPAFPPETTAGERRLCSSCSVEEQVFRKQTRRGFSFGACLEVVFTEHVAHIFRGDYEPSQSVSLSFGEWHLRHTKCGTWMRLSLSQGPASWASSFHSPSEFGCSALKDVFRGGSRVEGSVANPPANLRGSEPTEMRAIFCLLLPPGWPAQHL